MKKLITYIVIVSCMLGIAWLTGGNLTKALDTSDATWYGVVRITNNSTAASQVSVPFMANTTVYIDGGYMNSSANNTAITAAAGGTVPYMPGYEGNPWIVRVPSIGLNTILNDTLYMGGATDMEGDIQYFPDDAGASVVDDASMEPGANFTLSATGWIDTDAGYGNNIVNKESLALYISPIVSGNITASIMTVATDNFTPNAAGDYCNISGEVGAACPNHYQNVDDAPGAAADASYNRVPNAAAGFQHDSYETTNATGTIPAGSLINSVSVFFRIWSDGLAGSIAQPFLLLNSASTNGTAVGITGSAWENHIEIIARPGGGGWSLSDLDDLQVGIGLQAVGGGEQTRVSQTYLMVSYSTPTNSVSAIGVTSGEHGITANQTPALTFDGINDLVTVNSLTGGGFFGNAFTIMGWGRTDNWTGNKTIFSAGKVDNNNRATVYFEDASNRYAFESVGLAIRNVVFSPATFDNDSDWHFFAISIDADGHINHSIIDTVDYGANSTLTADLSTYDKFYIGQVTVAAANTGVMGGDITEIVVADSALTAEQIEQYRQFNYEPSVTEATLLMGEGIGATVSDTSGNGNDGTVTGALWSGYRLQLFIDDLREGVTNGVNVPGTSDDWTFFENMGGYWGSANLTVGGNLVFSFEGWTYSENFTDASGNGNTMIPSFRTTSSDADVSAELVSFRPVSLAVAPAYTVNVSTTGWITAPDTQSGNFTAATTNATYPGSDVIAVVTLAGNVPNNLLELILAGVGILSLSLFVTWAMRKRSISIFIKVLIISAGLGILTALSVFDSWILYIFLFITIAIAMAASQRTFTGTGNAGNNMIGFLTMSFVGCTTVNRILEGQFLKSSDVDILRETLAFQPFEVFGMFTISVPNISFLTHGIPSLMRWDYSVFGGNAQMFQYLLYSFTAVVSFILFVLMLGAMYQMFGRR